MIDDDRGLGIAPAHAVQLGQVGRRHQEAEGQAVVGGGLEHPLVPLVVQPAGPVAQARPGALAPNAEGQDAPPGQVHHGPVGAGQADVGHRRDDSRPHVVVGLGGDDVQNIAVVEAVPGHLDQVGAADPLGPAVAGQILGSEAGKPEVLFAEPRCQGILFGIRSPHVHVGVHDIGPLARSGSQRRRPRGRQQTQAGPRCQQFSAGDFLHGYLVSRDGLSHPESEGQGPRPVGSKAGYPFFAAVVTASV